MPLARSTALAGTAAAAAAAARALPPILRAEVSLRAGWLTLLPLSFKELMQNSNPNSSTPNQFCLRLLHPHLSLAI